MLKSQPVSATGRKEGSQGGEEAVASATLNYTDCLQAKSQGGNALY